MYHQSIIIVSEIQEKDHLVSFLGLEGQAIDLNILYIESGSIGIKDVGIVTQTVNKRSNNLKLNIILNSEKLTLEAQNALLKVLEEPAPNSLIALQTNNPEKLLETIKSRCKMLYDVKVAEDSEQLDIEFIFKNFADINYLAKVKIVDKFLKDYDNKESYKKAIVVILNELAKKRKKLDTVAKIEKAYKGIDVNISPKLIFDYIILLLD